MNVEQRQPAAERSSDHANRLWMRVRQQAANVHTHHRHLVITQLEI